MKKSLLLITALFVGAYSYAQCTAEAALNEDFSDFTVSTTNAFPQACWTASAGVPMMYTDANGANKYAVYYNANSANAVGYLVTPELSTIDGNHQLSFSTFKLAGPGGTFPAGNITVQVGTLSNPADFTTFVATGEPFAATEATVTHNNIIITASTTQKYIAFKIIGSDIHNAVAIDDVVWNQVPCAAVATLDENFSDFADDDLTAKCWSANAGAPMVNIDGEDDKYVSFYSFSSPNVAGYLVTPELTTIDGNHVLSFDTKKQTASAPGTTTIQIGTLSNPADFTTFVAVGTPYTVTATDTPYNNILIPASTTQKYIAFKIIADGSHVAIEIDNVKWTEAPCAAVASLDENFSDFADDDLTAKCWSANAGAPMVNIDGDEDKYVSFYSFSSPNVAGYLVTPELTTIDGNHVLSFDTKKQAASAPGTTTIQIGTLSNPADFTTFVAVGTPYTVTATDTPYNNILIPASTTQKYIAFKIIADGSHVAIEIDNVKWTESVAGVIENEKSSFSIFPNPTADKNVTISHNLASEGTVSIFTLTGAKVLEAKLGTGSQNLELSSLSSGMYIVRIEAGNQTESKKLIVK